MIYDTIYIYIIYIWYIYIYDIYIYMYVYILTRTHTLCVVIIHSQWWVVSQNTENTRAQNLPQHSTAGFFGQERYHSQPPGFQPKQLQEAGFHLKDMMMAGYSFPEVLIAGQFPVQEVGATVGYFFNPRGATSDSCLAKTVRSSDWTNGHQGSQGSWGISKQELLVSNPGCSFH